MTIIAAASTVMNHGNSVGGRVGLSGLLVPGNTDSRLFWARGQSTQAAGVKKYC